MGSVWAGFALTLIVGIVLLVVAHYLKRAFWHDLVRDVAIGFIVAGVVTVAYEYSTRTHEEHELTLQTLNQMASLLVPPDVWHEVGAQILRRGVVRRAVEIKLDVARNPRLPPGQVELRMTFAYDLHNLNPRAARVPIRHELDTALRNKELDLPRYDQIAIVGPGQPRKYEGDELRKLVDPQTGVIELAVWLPPKSENTPVRITSERVEVVNAPGSYYLLFPELAADVTVTIVTLPDDLHANVTTYYPDNDFTNPAPKEWRLARGLLPGQGFVVVFTRKS